MALNPHRVADPQHFFSTFQTIGPSRGRLVRRWLENFDPAHAPKTRPVSELRVDLAVSPEQAAQGGSIPIEVPIARVCKRCDGTGSTGFYRCDECDGHGMEWLTARVDVILSPPVRDNQHIEVPLRAIGVDNFYLNVRISLADA